MSDLAPIVYVIDDDISFLTAMGRLLRASGYDVRTFGSASEFLKGPRYASAGCIVLDVQMPELTGFDLQKMVSAWDNPLPIVFLTGQGDLPGAVRAMRNGAEDFLSKRAPKEDLLRAISRAIEREAREREQRARQNELRSRFSTLTAREREVLAHVIRGQLNKQIAADLAISERTVKLHRTAITSKLRVQSVAELVRLVQEAGVLKDGEILVEN